MPYYPEECESLSCVMMVKLLVDFCRAAVCFSYISVTEARTVRAMPHVLAHFWRAVLLEVSSSLPVHFLRSILSRVHSIVLFSLLFVLMGDCPMMKLAMIVRIDDISG